MAGAGGATPGEIKAAVREVMGRAASLYRRETSLRSGLGELEALAREVDRGLRARDADEAAALEARNMVLVARMVVGAALARTESRGAHQRLDFPGQDDATWRRHVAIVRAPGGEMKIDAIPVA
jgi:succinate dehydrogenase/fumarate reductase flavoprotein subunit